MLQKILVLSQAIFLATCLDQSTDSEWTEVGSQAVPVRNDGLGIFMLRTIGQGHFDVHFVTNDYEYDYLGLECDLTDYKTDYQFRIHGKCYLDDCCQMSGVPTSHERVWTFTTSSSGVDLDCNGVKVMSLKFSTLGNCLTTELKKTITSFFYINSDDQVTKSYMVIHASDCTGFDNVIWSDVRTKTSFPVSTSSKVSVYCPLTYLAIGDTTVTCLGGTAYSYDYLPRCIAPSCRSEVEESVVYGNYSWTFTKLGAVAELPCFFKGSEDVVATKLCVEETVKFADTNFMNCPSQASQQIKDILKETVTEDTQDAISQDISHVAKTLGRFMSSSDIEDTCDVIHKVIAVENLSDTALNNLINTVDGIQTLSRRDQLKEGDTGGSFRNATVGILLAVAAEADKEILIAKESIGFGVAKKTTSKDVLALAGSANVLSNSTNDENQTNTYFKAELPAKEDTIATAVYYQDDRSFPSQAVASTTDIVKQIQEETNDVAENGEGKKMVFFSTRTELFQNFSLVATLITGIQIVNKTSSTVIPLDAGNNVNMMFRVADSKSTITMVTGQTKRKTLVHSTLQCKFYDERFKIWSDHGCKTTFDYDDNGNVHIVNCLCDHLTSFAVLMSFERESMVAEELVTQILLIASLIGLALTILAHLPNWKLMKRRSIQINLMLSVSLLCSIFLLLIMDMFVAEDGKEDPSIPCVWIGVLLNYSWLTQLCWMVVEAGTLYLALVKVLGVHISRSMIKFSVFAWGLPIIFPLIGYVWGRSKFVDPKTCFISKPYGLVTFYAPVVIGILTNWILFLFIAGAIIKHSLTKAKQNPEQQSELTLRIKQAKSALAISSLLGLGWIVGFFLLFNNSNYSEITAIVRWLFILLNAPQGFFVFVFYVLLRDDLRAFWMHIFKCCSTSSGNVNTSKMSTQETSGQKVKVTTSKNKTGSGVKSVVNCYKPDNISTPKDTPMDKKPCGSASNVKQRETIYANDSADTLNL